MATTPDDGQPEPKVNAVFAQRTAESSATHLLPHIKPHHRILDVGCGPGTITLGLARRVPDGSVLGIDVDEEALGQAKKLGDKEGSLNVKFQAGNALDLSEFDDGTFDIVHAHQCVLHLPDPLKAFKEFRRVVKDGGIVSTRDNAFITVMPSDHAVAHTFDELHESTTPNPNMGRRHHMVAHEAGFAWDKIQTSCWTFQYADRVGRETWAAGADKWLRRAMLGATKNWTDAQMDEIAEQWKQWAALEEGRIIALDSALICFK